MPSHPQLLVPSAVGLFLLTVAIAFGMARAVRRLARDRKRDAGADLGWALRRLLDGGIEPRELREIGSGLDSETFWSAIEALPERIPRAARFRLSQAFSGSDHTRSERLALRYDSPWRRELAARRLGLIVEDRSRAVLRRALKQGPEAVTIAAARALGRYRDPLALHWTLRHPERFGSRAARSRVTVLRSFGRGALPRLCAALGTGIADAETRRVVIEVLGLGGHRPAAPALEHALTDPEPEVRVAAAKAIGRLRAEGCGLALMSALRDEAWPVRAQAAWALGRTRSGIAIRPLADRVADRAWWVRRHAAYALAELGEEGRLALREIAYSSDDRYAREMAIEVLGGGFKEFGAAS